MTQSDESRGWGDVRRLEYAPNEYLITFRPSALPAMASEVMATMDQIGVPLESRDILVRQVSVAAGELGVTDELAKTIASPEISILTMLERDNLIVDATPVRRPRAKEIMSNDQVPVGWGRMAAAFVEAFPDSTGRPSDAILSGSIIVRAANAAKAEEIERRLNQQYDMVASVERVPLRWTSQTVPAEAALPIAPWHLDRIRLREARSNPAFDDGRNVRVAVLDTGIDQDHSRLKANVDRYVYRADDLGVVSGTRDILAHGTHVGGAVATDPMPGNNEGVSNARLHIYKIFDDDLDDMDTFRDRAGNIFIQDIHYVNSVMYRRALAACLDENFEVINLSIGGSGQGDSREQALYRQIAAQDQVIVAAMGNERRDGSPTSWPAAYPGVTAVGALDLNDGVAVFSNHGDHIAISAPGVDILATMPTYKGVSYWTTRPGSNGQPVRHQPVHWTSFRGNLSGTSMASPQVAGAAALFVAKFGRGAAQFRQKLETSARKISAMGGQNFTVDHGYGCLDVAALLR